MTLLLDTTVLIDILRGRRERVEWMIQQAQWNGQLLTSAINVAEVYAGMRTGEERRTQRLFDDIRSLPTTQRIAERAGRLMREWQLRGRTLELADMVVAATALEHDLTLMTDNVKDFSTLGLRLHVQA